MWWTSSGERTLTGADAALLRESIADMTDSLHDEAEGLADEWPCGVKVFDELSWQQRLALLERVANALLKPDVPTPELSAVNEATVGAIFAMLRRNVEIELDEANDIHVSPAFDAYYWRRLVAACQESLGTGDDFYLEVESGDFEEWELLIECLGDRILWDADWDMPELFLDEEPDTSRGRREMLGIGQNYFVAPAPDPLDKDVPKLFANLHQLVGTNSG
jgi:hypothetical protein